MGKLLTIREAAGQLNLSVGKVKLMCSDGEIKAVKLGARWRITEEEIVRLQRGEVSAPIPESLTDIGIKDVQEFNEFKEALQRTQAEQDERAAELDRKDALVQERYKASLTIALRAEQLEAKRANHIALLNEAVAILGSLQSTYSCFSQGNLPHEGLADISTKLEEAG